MLWVIAQALIFVRQWETPGMKAHYFFFLFLVKISYHIIYSFSGQNTFENEIISEEILKGVYFNKLWQLLKAWYATAFDKKVYNYIVAI